MTDDRTDDEVSFFSSSHSGGGNCVEIAFTRDGVLLRSSRVPEHRTAFTADEWKAFLAGARDGEFDPAE